MDTTFSESNPGEGEAYVPLRATMFHARGLNAMDASENHSEG